MQGEPFDWHSRTHRALDGQLLAVIDSIHSFGICHRDLHSGNILVTSDDQIVVCWILLELIWNLLLRTALPKEGTWLCYCVSKPVAMQSLQQT